MGLSRLKVGVDVPWVTSWSDEEVLGVGPCATVDGRLAIGQAERAGHGRPQYSMNHHRRQRASIRGLLCPMCGAATPAGDRWTQTAKRAPAGVLRARGLGSVIPATVPDAQIIVNAGAIAPLHLACATRSLEHCPHLRADPTIEVLAFPDRWWVSALQVEAIADEAPRHFLADPTPPAPLAVVSFLQLCGITDETEPRWRRQLRPAGAARG